MPDTTRPRSDPADSGPGCSAPARRSLPRTGARPPATDHAGARPLATAGSRVLAAATRLVPAALLAAAFASPVLADGGGLPAATPRAYLEECGDCHVPYAPALLPAASWARLMAGLSRHFGSDASLEPQVAATLARYLQAHAGSERRTGPPPAEDRITRTARFERKHREVGASVWALPSVRTPSRCDACHAGALRGEFDDDDLVLPAGAASWRRAAASR